MLANYLAQVQVAAKIFSLLIYTVIAKWYIIPWLNRLSRMNALLILLWVNVPRYVTFIFLSAQDGGYPISNSASMEAISGDVLGAIIAFLTIVGFRINKQLGILLSWVFVLETLTDILIGFARKAQEPLWGKAQGVTWLLLVFYVTLIMVCLPIMIQQLYRRRKESLDM